METITSPRDIDALFKHGRRVRTPTIIALWGPTPGGRSSDGRAVFVAGTRLGNAVLRNRSKRVLRAAVRNTGAAWPGRDVALIATPQTSNAPAEQVKCDLNEVLGRTVETP